MRGIAGTSSTLYARCRRVRVSDPPQASDTVLRYVSNSSSPPAQAEHDRSRQGKPEPGAMSRRLADMSERSLETGGRGARRAVEEAGFSEELKKRLEDKIAGANFRNEKAAAFAQANLPASASKHARDIAGARPWNGTETVEDASSRMLHDAHRPLRAPRQISGVQMPKRVDTGRPTQDPAPGKRLANARDRSSVYSALNEGGMSEEEREKYRAELKNRFAPHARSLPATIQGLQSLANERIEDAIARGQFKNLPRGKKIERDYNANSPFINTTEYFMNKIIQKQEIVPPWIEKQQELVSTATKFRARLRADWRRHVARTISSKGGSVESQMKLAEEYALAESELNPSTKNIEQVNTVTDDGHVSQITLTGELKQSPRGDVPSEEEVKIVEQIVKSDGHLGEPQEVKVTAELPPAVVGPPPPRRPTVPPFRDAQWEQTEGSYLRAAVDQLNSLTRSYNLMAPDLAKKTYYSLDRELRSCFADVAPQVAGAIRERAYAPKLRGVEVIGHKPGGVLERFSSQSAQVYDEQKPQYGFRQFWRDLWSSGTKT